MLTLRVDSHEPDPATLEPAIDALLEGQVVAFPTDTIWGLGVDATNRLAVERLAAIKGRAADEPFPVIINNRRVLEGIVEDLSAEAQTLLNRFWPGGLTVILRRRGQALDAVAPRGAIGVRIPDHPVALALARGLARPLVATSANRSGESPLTSAGEIIETFGGEISFVVDCGPIQGGKPSTVLDLSGEVPRLLREGAIAADRIARYLPELVR